MFALLLIVFIIGFGAGLIIANECRLRKRTQQAFDELNRLLERLTVKSLN
jgi:hypothetical protein